jgi:hypothetical protein
VAKAVTPPGDETEAAEGPGRARSASGAPPGAPDSAPSAPDSAPSAPDSAPSAPDPQPEALAQDGLPLNLNLGRVAWLLTVATLVVGGTLLALRGDYGYAAVAGVVALAAAINIF